MNAIVVTLVGSALPLPHSNVFAGWTAHSHVDTTYLTPRLVYKYFQVFLSTCLFTNILATYPTAPSSSWLAFLLAHSTSSSSSPLNLQCQIDKNNRILQHAVDGLIVVVIAVWSGS